AGQCPPITGKHDNSRVDSGRNRHPSDGCKHRDAGLPHVTQAADNELVLELDPDHEEEDCEQTVGSPGAEGQIEVQRGWPQHGLDHREVRVPDGRARPDKRKGSCGDQQRTAGGLPGHPAAQPSAAGQAVNGLRAGEAGHLATGCTLGGVQRCSRARAPRLLPTRLPGSPYPRVPADASGLGTTRHHRTLVSESVHTQERGAPCRDTPSGSSSSTWTGCTSGWTSCAQRPPTSSPRCCVPRAPTPPHCWTGTPRWPAWSSAPLTWPAPSRGCASVGWTAPTTRSPTSAGWGCAQPTWNRW